MTAVPMQGLPPNDRLPNGWRVARFEGIFREPLRNGIYKKKEFHGSGSKIINMGELFGFDFISGQEMKRLEVTPEELRKFAVEEGDLLFARRSLIFEGSGKCSLVIAPPEPTAFESSIIRARLDVDQADPRFYFYLFSSPVGRALMASIATRTAVSGIRGSDLIALGVPVPPLVVQKRISNFLSTYDDLIENNSRRIALLEEMAQAIYREWFVNFRFPGHEQVEMVESKVGPVPAGWEVKRVEDAITLSYGKALKANDRNDGSVPVYGSSGVVGYHDRGLVHGPGIVVGRKGNVGSVHWCDTDFYPIDTTYYVETRLDLCYVYFNLQQQNFINNDAAVPGLNRRQAYSLPLLVPGREVLSRFSGMVSLIFAQLLCLRRRSALLRQTRDLLLPRLLSGEIDVAAMEEELAGTG